MATLPLGEDLAQAHDDLTRQLRSVEKAAALGWLPPNPTTSAKDLRAAISKIETHASYKAHAKKAAAEETKALAEAKREGGEIQTLTAQVSILREELATALAERRALAAAQRTNKPAAG